MEMVQSKELRLKNPLRRKGGKLEYIIRHFFFFFFFFFFILFYFFFIKKTIFVIPVCVLAY